MVLRVLLGYRGGLLDREIACVYNKCMCVRGFSGERTVSPEEIRSLWFEYSTFNPNEFSIATYGGRVYGIAFTRVYGVAGSIWLCIDPYLPRYYLLETIYHMLSWPYHVLSSRRVCVVKISCGYEFSPLYSLVRSVVGACFGETILTLMEYHGSYREYCVPGNVVIRKATLDDVEGIVGVWDKAFRKYSWFEEWRMDEAIKWYSTKELIVYVLVDRETGRVVGYVDGEVRRGVDGERYGYAYTLAVHPHAQGRGLGSILLNHMVKALASYGVKGIYLDALHGLENYYSRHGFRVKRRYRVLVTTIDCLPRYNPAYIRVG